VKKDVTGVSSKAPLKLMDFAENVKESLKLKIKTSMKVRFQHG
jgi:hypothetical protein